MLVVYTGTTLTEGSTEQACDNCTQKFLLRIRLLQVANFGQWTSLTCNDFLYFLHESKQTLDHCVTVHPLFDFRERPSRDVRIIEYFACDVFVQSGVAI
jgi:hypothetical protein